MSKYQDKTRAEYNEWLDSLDYNHNIKEIVHRLLDSPVYHWGEGKDAYEQLRMENKPSRSTFQLEFNEWRAEEKVRISLIFDDLELESELRSKVNHLKNPDVIVRTILGMDAPNITVYLNGLIDSKDSEQIDLLVSKQAEAQAWLDRMNGKESRKEIGLRSRKVCDAALAVLGGWTVQLEMSEEDVDGLETMFSEVRDALIVGRAIKAHRLIGEMDLGNSGLTEEMKQEMLEEFAPLGL